MQILNEGMASTNQMTKELEDEMNRIVKADLPLTRNIISKSDAADIFSAFGEYDKVEILQYRPEKTAHVYECNGYKNYMKRMKLKINPFSKEEVKKIEKVDNNLYYLLFIIILNLIRYISVLN